MSMIYDSYMNYTRELKKEYGERSIVFLHVGSFIEVYGKNVPGICLYGIM